MRRANAGTASCSLPDFYRSIIGAAFGLLVGAAGVIITVHHNSHKVDRANKNFQPDHPILAFLKEIGLLRLNKIVTGLASNGGTVPPSRWVIVVN